MTLTYGSNVCVPCAIGDHRNHRPGLGGICVGCACQFVTPRSPPGGTPDRPDSLEVKAVLRGAASRSERGEPFNETCAGSWNVAAGPPAQSPQVGAAPAGESEGLGLPPPPRRGGEWWHADRLAHWECPTCRAGYDAGAGLVCEGDQGKCHPAASTKAHGTPAEPCEEARCLSCGWAGTIPAHAGRSASGRPLEAVASADPELEGLLREARDWIEAASWNHQAADLRARIDSALSRLAGQEGSNGK